MKSVHRDRALNMLVSFIGKIGNHESYIALLRQRNDTRDMIVNTFSKSSYLSRLLLGLENLEGIFEYPDIRMDYKSLKDRLINTLAHEPDPKDAVREFKISEELESGLLFLGGFVDIYRFLNTLSMLADTIIRALIKFLSAGSGFAVIGLGGIGARELNINSDLDLIFISEHGKNNKPHKISSQNKIIAEEFIKFLSEYTAKGYAYKVDMRLRPDGSKGILLHDIEGYKNYYLKSAHPWELQVLLGSRPIAGDKKLLRAFLGLKRKILLQRGEETSAQYIREMRKKIMHETSRETSGYDIKNGPGGLKEIEFLVQYLQLTHMTKFPDLITHSTVTAVKRLARYDILDAYTEAHLLKSHRFLKIVETLLRLNEEDMLKPDSETADIIFRFLEMKSGDELIRQVEDMRQKVIEITRRFYE